MKSILLLVISLVSFNCLAQASHWRENVREIAKEILIENYNLAGVSQPHLNIKTQYLCSSRQEYRELSLSQFRRYIKTHLQEKYEVPSSLARKIAKKSIQFLGQKFLVYTTSSGEQYFRCPIVAEYEDFLLDIK